MENKATNLGDVKVSGAEIILRSGSALVDIEAQIKKKIKPEDVLQFGQILKFLHIEQTTAILFDLGYKEEAALIYTWFNFGNFGCAGMLNAIPGAWDQDRITKYIFKNKTHTFVWVDREKYRDGMLKWHNIALTETELDKAISSYIKIADALG